MDYYQILGIARNASLLDVKRAYRRLARKYHPDVSNEFDSEQRFKEVAEAYEVLSNPQKKAVYDQENPDVSNGHSEQTIGTGPHGKSPFGRGVFGDIFEDLFIKEGFSGFHDRRNAAELTGEDVETKITIDLADSYTGADRLMTLDIGRGRTRTFNVKIPKGILSGQKIRLSGQGVPDIGGGMPGDLFLQVFFRESMQYRIDEADVFCRLHVSPWEAALGAPVIFPLPGGRQVELKIPRNSSGGQKLRLEGCGIPASPPGDLFIELVIVLPKADSENARHAYQSFKKSFDFHPRG